MSKGHLHFFLSFFEKLIFTRFSVTTQFAHKRGIHVSHFMLKLCKKTIQQVCIRTGISVWIIEELHHEFYIVLHNTNSHELQFSLTQNLQKDKLPN